MINTHVWPVNVVRPNDHRPLEQASLRIPNVASSDAIFPPPYEYRGFVTSGTDSGTVSSVGNIPAGGFWYTSDEDTEISSGLSVFSSHALRTLMMPRSATSMTSLGSA